MNSGYLGARLRRGAHRVDLSGHIVDLPGQHGEVFSEVLADPGTHKIMR